MTLRWGGLGGSDMQAVDTDQMAEKPLFQGLSQEQLARLATILKVRAVGRGEAVVSEHAYGDSLFLIHRGRVSVRVASPEGERCVAELEAARGDRAAYAGDFFGEMCLLDLEPRCATVVADSPCELWELNRDDLYWLFGDDKELQLKILLNVARVLSRRLQLMDRNPLARTGGTVS